MLTHFNNNKNTSLTAFTHTRTHWCWPRDRKGRRNSSKLLQLVRINDMKWQCDTVWSKCADTYPPPYTCRCHVIKKQFARYFDPVFKQHWCAYWCKALMLYLMCEEKHHPTLQPTGGYRLIFKPQIKLSSSANLHMCGSLWAEVTDFISNNQPQVFPSFWECAREWGLNIRLHEEA